MVCDRCVLMVKNILDREGVAYKNVVLGEVELEKPLEKTTHKNLEEALKSIGFEIIETRLNKIIEDIKILVLEYLEKNTEKKINLSVFITQKLPYDYSYLSDLFSSAEGKSIEQYFINQRIEKVKELLVYDQLSLTEIAYQLGFSSVHHLSAQFKKTTGLTPSHFKSIGTERRSSIDKL